MLTVNPHVSPLFLDQNIPTFEQVLKILTLLITLKHAAYSLLKSFIHYRVKN